MCDGGSVAPVAELERGLDALGPSVNGVRRFGDDIYIVESGSNTIARLDPSTGVASQWVDVGNERSPWDVWAIDDELWITNFVADTVTVADRDTGEVLAEVRDDTFAGPAGIAATAEHVYVDGEKVRTLEGEPLAEDFIAMVEAYVEAHYPRAEEPATADAR